MTLHSALANTAAQHGIHRWTVADAAGLAALVPLAADIGKVARQTDTGQFFVLRNDVGPVWADVTATGGPPSGAAGGGLGGTYPNPTVNGMTAGVLTDDAAHGVRGGGTQHAAASGGSAGFMSAADKTKLDGVATAAAALTASAPANVTKAAAAVGVATAAARADHKHDVTTAAPGAGGVVAGGSASEGAATSLARSDHTHAVSVAAPVSIGTANSAGAAATFPRSDHVHAHGSQPIGAGTNHAEATESLAGFLPASDKVKVNDIGAVQAFGNSGASITLNWTSYLGTMTLTGNAAITLGTAPRPGFYTLTVSTGAGGFTPTHTNVLRANGVEFSPSLSASNTSRVNYFFDGSAWSMEFSNFS